MNDAQKINKEVNIEEIMSEFQTLSVFANAKDWCKRAASEIERISGIVRGLDIEIARDSQALERLKYEQSKKSLVGRLFGGGNDDEETGLTKRLEEYKRAKSELIKTEMRLYEAIDFTPKSPEEQKSLLNELRQRKRDLQEKKREITTVMRGIRKEAQPEDATFDAVTINRRKTRYDREAELLPQETTSASVNRQMAQVDRDIAWAEKFN